MERDLSHERALGALLDRLPKRRRLLEAADHQPGFAEQPGVRRESSVVGRGPARLVAGHIPWNGDLPLVAIETHLSPNDVVPDPGRFAHPFDEPTGPLVEVEARVGEGEDEPTVRPEHSGHLADRRPGVPNVLERHVGDNEVEAGRLESDQPTRVAADELRSARTLLLAPSGERERRERVFHSDRPDRPFSSKPTGEVAIAAREVEDREATDGPDHLEEGRVDDRPMPEIPPLSHPMVSPGGELVPPAARHGSPPHPWNRLAFPLVVRQGREGWDARPGDSAPRVRANLNGDEPLPHRGSIMRILTFDELPAALEPSRALLQMIAFSSFYTRTEMRVWRQKTRRMADYAGVFAVEGDRVLGEVYVLRIPYTFPEGTELIGGLATVTTNPDERRSGIAAALIREAHQRERDAGIRYVTLWTNPSWGAHALYEKLGYRDVYSSPWAVRQRTSRVPLRRRARGIRFARPSDLEAIEQLHDRSAEGRLGFCRRPKGSLRAMALVGRLDPKRQLLVYRVAGELVGYAYLDRTPQRTGCGELVAATFPGRRALFDEVVRLTGRAPCAFQHSVVTDAPEFFRGRDFARSRGSWWGWMATEVGRDWTATEAVDRLTTNDPRFLCYSGDRF